MKRVLKAMGYLCSCHPFVSFALRSDERLILGHEALTVNGYACRFIMQLGPRGSTLLHCCRWVGIFVERCLLVNEPAVSSPQDQVQEAESL